MGARESFRRGSSPFEERHDEVTQAQSADRREIGATTTRCGTGEIVRTVQRDSERFQDSSTNVQAASRKASGPDSAQ